MALIAYLSLKGQKTGQIKGGLALRGHEGKIGVIAVSHSVVSPRDPQSGLPTGQRQHKPFVFTKELDKSTPILYNVLSTNENLSEVVFEFSAPSAQKGIGGEAVVYRVKLTNANIASIDFRMLNMRDPALQRFAECEEIALTYQRIEWVWVDGGVTSDDDWGSNSGRQ